jgi:protein disulfide-isomerase A6
VDYDSGRSAQDIATYAVKKLQQLVNKKLGTSADAKTESTDKKTESADTKPEAETEEIPVNEEDIIVLNDDNFEETVLGNDEVWFVNFHAVWCSHCKRLNPDWAKSATMLKGQVNFVKVDAIYNTRLVAKYDVKSYPTIKIFLPGNETPEDYNGPRDAELLIKEAYKRLDTLGIAPKIPQIVSSQVLNNHCEKDICIIAFLPHIYDSSIAERNRYLEILKVTAKKYRKNPLKYLWAQAGDFLELEKLFGVGFGYPSIAGISLMKNKFALMTSSYINEEIELFSKRLLRGNLPLTEYKDLPSIQTVPLWNENIPAQRENTVTPDEITHQKDGSSEYL